MSSRLRAALILVLATGLLGWFIRQADLAEVWREIRSARLGLIAVAIASMIANMAIRALRWQYLLAPLGPTHFWNAFRTTTIGFAVSFLLPARAGEFVRPYLMARREQLSATGAFATIVLERVLDLVTVLLMFGSFVLLFDPGVEAMSPATYRSIKIGGGVVAITALVSLVALIVFAGNPAGLSRVALKIERVLPARAAHVAARLVGLFGEGLAVARDPRRLLIALLLSLPLWLSVAFGIWTVCHAFHIDVPYTGSFLIVALLVVGVAVPTPGAIGGFHEAFRIGATAFFGAPNDRAVGAGLALHALSFVPVTILGIFFTTQDGLSLTRVGDLAGLAAEGKPD
jgi:uncharacterized protein (TIRG00374 family)